MMNETIEQIDLDLISCQYWYNVHAFDVFCAIKDQDVLAFEMARVKLKKYERIIRIQSPNLYNHIKRFKDWRQLA